MWKPSSADHSRIVPSALPLASVSPSGENARERTSHRCPPRTASVRPVSTDHSLISLSSPPVVARSEPSGEKARATTIPLCLSSRLSS